MADRGAWQRSRFIPLVEAFDNLDTLVKEMVESRNDAHYRNFSNLTRTLI